MSTEYSNYGSYIDASSVTQYEGSEYRAYIWASVTDNGSSCSISLAGDCEFVHFTGGYQSISTLNGTSITDGNTHCIDTITGNGTAASGHGAGSTAVTVNKTSSVQYKTYSCLQNVMGLGTSTASVTVTIPAAAPSTAVLTVSKGDYIKSVSGGGTKTIGASVTVTAVENDDTSQYDYGFDGWYKGATKKSSNKSYTFTMPGSNLTLTAKGTRTTKQYTATAVSGGNGTATVNGQSSVIVNYGTNVTYVATPNAHYAFSSWSDGDTNATRTVQVTSSITLTATFVKKEGEIGVKADDAWKQGTAYVKVSGEWKAGTVYIKQNGTWQLTKGV